MSTRNRLRRSSSQFLRSSIPATIETLDKRVLLAAAAGARVAASTLKADVAEQWIARQFVPTLHTVTGASGALSKAKTGSARKVGIGFLRGQVAANGVDGTSVDQAQVTASYTDEPANGGMTHTYLQETFNGLPVLNALANVSVNSRGQVLSASNNFIDLPAAGAIGTPTLGITSTLTKIAADLGLSIARGLSVVSTASTADRATRLLAPDLSKSPIDAKLAYVAAKDGTPQLVWHLTLDLPDGSHWYELGVSVKDGAVLFATDYVDSYVDGSQYDVYALPTISPSDGTRTLVTNPSDTVASPFGWQDTNGVAGAESTFTVGNNVSAQEDRDANNSTQGLRANGGSTLNFDFPLDFASAPTTTTNQAAAITNLFYLNNRIHDITYRYGFTDAAGNFQTNNYGRGGLGNDAVQADAQDASGTNNANFATPPDGTAGRMQMYLFTTATPQRDGDLDATVVVHEYTHGISTRLTGGPANSSALDALQSGGMGEGWGDWLALLLTMKPTDTGGMRRPSGTYVEAQAPTGAGIRRYPYSTDKAIDPEVSSLFNSSNEVHNAGEIWCTVLWDMTWALINKLGKSTDVGSNIGAGYTVGGTNGGDQLALRLVLDGMKLQPSNPSFKDARDAILTADQNLTGGANQREIWSAFAGRGFGVGFVDASANATSVIASYDTPSPDPIVRSADTLDLVTAPSSVTLSFSEAIDPTSFSVADDVTSFVGPGGTNLKSTISGFAFTSPTTLRIDFASLPATGTYTLSVGPNINAADDGHAMDQDRDGIVGESTDGFTQTINFQPFTAADGAGYRVGPASYDASIDLTAGATGVITVVNGADDAAAAINLGASKFTFYGTQYTGAASLYASSNGLITFGTSSTAYTNTDLTSSPTQPSIAVLWNDWVTNTAGTLDAVLARLDDTTGDGIADRLIVEWNDVRDVDSTGNGVTFRAVLQLNTGATPGAIVMSYPDLDTGVATSSFGAGSTVGIKAAGTQTTASSASRQLLEFNQTNYRYITQGKAVRVAVDVEAPRVAQESYDFNVSGAIKLGFTESVDASLTADDFTLFNRTTGVTVSPTAYNIVHDASNNAVSLVPTAPLPDGNYRVTLSASGISDVSGLALDGDGDFLDGGDHTFDFFVLAGDANRDRKVDFSDLLILAQNFGKTGQTFAQGNFNYSADGTVDFSDLLILAQKFGTTLTVPAGILGAVAASSGTSSSRRVAIDVLG